MENSLILIKLINFFGSYDNLLYAIDFSIFSIFLASVFITYKLYNIYKNERGFL